MSTKSASRAVRYGPGEDYDGTFHVTDDEDGGRTVAVCPTWEDAERVSAALNWVARERAITALPVPAESVPSPP